MIHPRRLFYKKKKKSKKLGDLVFNSALGIAILGILYILIKYAAELLGIVINK